VQCRVNHALARVGHALARDGWTKKWLTTEPSGEILDCGGLARVTERLSKMNRSYL